MTAVEQPAGFVTLVFTDVEGSTRLLRRLGEEAYRQVLSAYREGVCTAFGGYGGYEVDAEGDGFFYAFASAEAAAGAVKDALAVLETGPIRMRIGVHSGAPGLDPPKYIGLDVHKAARVMAAGHGGQVLVSQATREVLGERFTVRYLGEYRLKDLESPERLYQLGEGDFPPLRTLHHTNLPTPATSFVGRERELADVLALVRTRLPVVTLAGPGGSGKTRLALQSASALSEEFPDGVWWVPLAPLREAMLVLPEVARVLGIDETDAEPAEHLGEVLAGRRALLVLDNAEHLLPEAAVPLAVLRDLDGPALVVTSRERLQITGEHVYHVPPLDATEGPVLFEQRVRALDPSFEPATTVSELCRRLDQLPLAIELAAAQAVALSPEQILQRLSQRLDLPAAGRDADPRQRTLRATIEWSYALLDDKERELFARLAVFTGGCTLEAAEEVCEAGIATLARLVDKSLVRRSGGRFVQLETIREYGAERLHASDEFEPLRRRHADFYIGLAAEAREGLRSPAAALWLDRIEHELPNLRSAVALLFDRGDAGGVLQLTTCLRRFWSARNEWEARGWLERALATGAGTATERGEALLAAASLASMHGDFERRLAFAREAVEVAERCGDDATLAQALGMCAWGLAERGDERAAIEMTHRAHELAPRVTDPSARAEVLRYISAALAYSGDLELAATLDRQVLSTYRELGDEMAVALTLNGIGYKAMLRGDYDDAVISLEESLEIARRLKFGAVRMILSNLGLVAAFEEHYREALSLLGEGLQLAAAAGDRANAAEAVLGLAAAHAALGQYELAVKLEAIANAEFDAMGVVEPGDVLERLEPPLRIARDACGKREIDPLARQGQPLTLQTAIAELEAHSTQGL